MQKRSVKEYLGGIKMTYELRLKGLKDDWMQIQEMWDEQSSNRKKIQKLISRQRQLGQVIKDRLKQHGKMMP